jgi:hypothetical protein
MVVLRSGNAYIKSESDEPSSDIELSSAVIVSMPLLSPPPETPIETRPLCECGNPFREEICMGLGNTAHAGQVMYLCPLVGKKKCTPGFRWKHEVDRLPETNIKQEPDANGIIKREVTPAADSAVLTPPTSPPERPPLPT